jgi:K+-sensing histidine kinase KdpD
MRLARSTKGSLASTVEEEIPNSSIRRSVVLLSNVSNLPQQVVCNLLAKAIKFTPLNGHVFVSKPYFHHPGGIFRKQWQELTQFAIAVSRR